jgi:CRP/FNR family cyclic AMP-dependent transcriptional regulator
MVSNKLPPGVELFEFLNDGDRADLSARLKPVLIPAGETIFRAGDPGNSLFIICSGEVEIFIHDDTGHKIVLEQAKAGSAFGELSMLDGGPRSASAVVTNDVEALCMDDETLNQFLKQHPSAAMAMLASMSRRLRVSAERLRRTASRNVNTVADEKRSLITRVVHTVAAFTGSVLFLNLNVLIFVVWIAVNLGWVPLIPRFDPYPFGLLTTIVSLEAIILSGFVLISQNLQSSKDRVRSDIEYEVNLKAELEIAHLHEKVDHLNAKVLARLDNLEKILPKGAHNTTAFFDKSRFIESSK